MQANFDSIHFYRIPVYLIQFFLITLNNSLNIRITFPCSKYICKHLAESFAYICSNTRNTFAVQRTCWHVSLEIQTIWINESKCVRCKWLKTEKSKIDGLVLSTWHIGRIDIVKLAKTRCDQLPEPNVCGMRPIQIPLHKENIFVRYLVWNSVRSSWIDHWERVHHVDTERESARFALVVLIFVCCDTSWPVANMAAAHFHSKTIQEQWPPDSVVRTVSRKRYQPNCRRCELWSIAFRKSTHGHGARKRWQCHWHWVSIEWTCRFGSSIIRRLLSIDSIREHFGRTSRLFGFTTYGLVHLMAGACRPLVRTLAKSERFFGFRSFSLFSWIFYFDLFYICILHFTLGAHFRIRSDTKQKRENFVTNKIV